MKELMQKTEERACLQVENIMVQTTIKLLLTAF